MGAAMVPQQLHCDASGISPAVGVVTSISAAIPINGNGIMKRKKRTGVGILCFPLHSW